MYRLALLLFAVAMTSPIEARTGSPQSAAPRHSNTDRGTGFAKARTVIAQILKDTGAPSIAVSVAKDGKFIWEEGFGWADRECKVRATANTVYSIASITKPITGTAAMILREEGRLDLDAPIETYLRGLKLRAYAGSSKDVTARRVMSHSAGLPQYATFYMDGAEPASSEKTISRYGMIVFPPGSRFEYSNIGMKLLETAITNVSGEGYGEYIRRHVFLPLGMMRSALKPDPSWAIAKRYDEHGKPIPFYRSDTPGTGDIWSSAHDLVRFAMFHMGTPLPDQKIILPRSKVLEMQVPISAPPFEPFRMGLNWAITNVGGHPKLLHYGGQPGVRTVLAFYPDQKLAVAVLSNSDAPFMPDDVLNAIVGEVAPDMVPAAATDETAKRDPPMPEGSWAGTISNHAGQEPFELEFQKDGDIHVRIGEGMPTLLSNAAWNAGAFTGQFYGKVNMEEAAKYPTDLTLKVVPHEGELVGELIAFSYNEKTLFTLPSFVRLHRQESVKAP